MSTPFNELTPTIEIPACCPNCFSPLTMEHLSFGHYCALRPLSPLPTRARPRVGALLALVLCVVFGLLACDGGAPLDPTPTQPAGCTPAGRYHVTIDDVAGSAEYLPPSGIWTAALQSSDPQLLELDGPDHAVIVVALDSPACGGISSSSGGASDGSAWRTSITFGFDAVGFAGDLAGWGTTVGAYRAHLSGVKLPQ